ncbi:hypothetical protein KIL84_006605 [Mauremys mutica]|uniref:Uncharacterized protein n=1 Tax=Mauremys mutica TaxID=74926 RepID=A0A9D3X1G8_9SAUR|nr:hypothetical protein KIL84_006605 [Mauremys mutica]
MLRRLLGGDLVSCIPHYPSLLPASHNRQTQLNSPSVTVTVTHCPCTEAFVPCLPNLHGTMGMTAPKRTSRFVLSFRLCCPLKAQSHATTRRQILKTRNQYNSIVLRGKRPQLQTIAGVRQGVCYELLPRRRGAAYIVYGNVLPL